MKDSKDIYPILKEALTLRNDLEETKAIDKEKAYRTISDKIRKEERKKKWILPLQRVASILLIPFILSTLYLTYLYYNVEVKSNYLTYTEIVAAPGTIVETTLPDESKVWLNAGSRLRFPHDFTRAVRPVELHGEGFFQVKTDPAVPFEVTLSSGMKVIARGTSFNISAYEDDFMQEIVLEEGLVEVWAHTQSYTLKPGQIVTLDKISKEFLIRVGNTYDKTAWKNGMLVFRRTSLEEVLKKLSRRYNVTINLAPGEEDYMIRRATFSTESVYQILDFLKVITPIEWSLKEVKQNQDSTFPRQEIDVWLK